MGVVGGTVEPCDHAGVLDQDGEVLLAAWHNDTLAGIGGITLDPATPGALRMRWFYVHPTFRGVGIGRALAGALLGHAQRLGRPILFNAGTKVAPAFWEALGFVADLCSAGHTHRLPAAG